MFLQFENKFKSAILRFKTIFDFTCLSPWNKVFKCVLLLIFIYPYFIVQIFNVLFSLFLKFPILGFIMQFTLCFLLDLLEKALFYIIMLPHKIK